MLTREEQIAHLKQPANLALFKADYDATDVDEYFADYYEQWEQDNGRPGDALYRCVCSDLGIAPLRETDPDAIKLDRIRGVLVNDGRSRRGRERSMLEEIERILGRPKLYPARRSPAWESQGKAARARDGEEV